MFHMLAERELWDIVLPISASISTLVIFVLLASLIRSFTQQTTSRSIVTIPASVFFFLAIGYNFYLVLNRTVIDAEACALRINLACLFYFPMRGSLFYFLLCRMYMAFQDTAQALSNSLFNWTRFSIITHVILIL